MAADLYRYDRLAVRSSLLRVRVEDHEDIGPLARMGNELPRKAALDHIVSGKIQAIEKPFMVLIFDQSSPCIGKGLKLADSKEYLAFMLRN